MEYHIGGAPALSHGLINNKRRGSDSIDAGLVSKKKRSDDLISGGYSLQANNCKSYPFGTHLSCFVCSASSGMLPTSDDECRFRNIRWFKAQEDESFLFIFDGSSVRNEDHNSYGYHDWNPSQTESHKLLIKVEYHILLDSFHCINFPFGRQPLLKACYHGWKLNFGMYNSLTAYLKQIFQAAIIHVVRS